MANTRASSPARDRRAFHTLVPIGVHQDDNTSLSLCRTSCEQYYRACKYDVNETDGLFDACRNETVKDSGLFDSGIAGPDMALAEDTMVCRSTEGEVDSMSEAEAAKPAWIFTTQGLAVVGVTSFVVLSCSFYLLVPEGLRSYAWWCLTGLFRRPLNLWRRLPIMKGSTVLVLFFSVFFALFIWGFIRRVSDNGGFGRYKENLDFVESSGSMEKAQDMASGAASMVSERSENVQSELSEILRPDLNETRNFTNYTGEFVPDPASFELATAQSLTFGQRRQLLASCTCTGGAVLRAAGLSGLAWAFGVVAWVSGLDL
mmetsp:Transcript_161431/g.518383  ORF Transcript_161431/g.518383 Transcript_161431/m.518383 type:complete len:316 (+) Transcript_161431:1108-2055(+)